MAWLVRFGGKEYGWSAQTARLSCATRSWWKAARGSRLM